MNNVLLEARVNQDSFPTRIFRRVEQTSNIHSYFFRRDCARKFERVSHYPPRPAIHSNPLPLVGSKIGTNDRLMSVGTMSGHRPASGEKNNEQRENN